MNFAEETEMNVHTRDLICSFCDLVFTRPFCLKRHLKNVHVQQQWDLNGGILKEFNTFCEFVTWKEEEENKTMSKYVRQRGSKTLKNGDIVMSFHCCRSGTYKPKGKGLKSLKSQGSAKIGISCPAIIKVRQSTENVVVQYFPKHKNHENQLEHLRLSESDRTTIAGRLKEGVSEKKILQDMKEEITVDSGRKMLIKKKDIHNIKRDFNINGYIKRHEVDAASVKLHTHNEEIQEIYVNENDILKEIFDFFTMSPQIC
ncbi:MULE domain-containing protein [Trichonephila clavata]|uniref:MULE domain-containing protein n=1 Tax=Trichonephila clavata TaxID=2740835 RepID=A0A8X6GG33_TRICU|nr:MULE domain-containing protein [Trichonephila clavata]